MAPSMSSAHLHHPQKKAPQAETRDANYKMHFLVQYYNNYLKKTKKMNWKVSVYRFLEKNFTDEINNSITTSTTEVKAKMIELSASDIIIIGTALKNSRTIWTAYITDSITGGIILTFKRKIL
jgi:hypothetical protein